MGAPDAQHEPTGLGLVSDGLSGLAVLLAMEHWRPVPASPYYFVSSQGRVKSVRPAQKRINPPVEKLLKPGVQSSGYYQIRIIKRHWLVHRLMLEAFVGPPASPSMQARHLDGNRLNNHLANLAWGTIAENARDRVAHGQLSKPQLSPEARREMCLRYGAGESVKDLAVAYGVHMGWVYEVIRGKRWLKIVSC